MTTQVLQLFCKLQVHAAVESQPQLTLKQNWGIEGDANACTGSPRQVLLVAAQTIDRFQLQPGQLRENIVLSQANIWQSGQVLQIGSTALIRLTFLCEPCAYLNTISPGLSDRIQGQRGFLGMVVRGGQVEVGDIVQPIAFAFPPLSDQPKDRFLEFVARIPFGKVVKTSQLILALGVTRSHYRVIPTWMKKAAADLPVHRIVTVEGGLFSQHLPDQKTALLAEGVEIVNDRISEAFYWDPQFFHDLGPF